MNATRKLLPLLVVFTGLAAYLIGHRSGFDAGYSKASAEYGDDLVSASRYYDVSDSVIPLSD